MASLNGQHSMEAETDGPAPAAPEQCISAGCSEIANGSSSDLLASKQWHVHHGDCITHMSDLPPACMDMAAFSPPFPAVYAYTDQECDIGNSEGLRTEAALHFSFFFRQLARVVKPGRVICCHVQQIPRMKRSGEVGLHDFRGMNIRIAERAGLVYEYDWMIRKNPQAQAIRTRSRELQFAGLESDRAKTRGTLADYILKFRAPGNNETPINAKGELLFRQQLNAALDYVEGLGGGGGPTAWGAITGTLADQTDLDTALDGKAAAVHSHATSDVTGLDTALSGKQATLVSGTNIKTVNGTTLLGSGDLVVSGGSNPLVGWFV